MRLLPDLAWLLPVRRSTSPETRAAGTEHGKGCGVYSKPAMRCLLTVELPVAARDRTEALRRPDRAGYVH